MRQPEQFSAAVRDQRMHRFVAVEEARPCHGGDGGIKRGRARPAVKRIVAVPQGKPLCVVVAGDEPNGEIAGHEVISEIDGAKAWTRRRVTPAFTTGVGEKDQSRRRYLCRCYSAARRCRARLRWPPRS